METYEAIMSRRSVRDFRPDPIGDEEGRHAGAFCKERAPLAFCCD